MERTIKFRGYNTINKKWIYGYYIVNRGESFICPDGIQPPEATWEDFLVEAETIGQFTGLFDRNGKEIYEGDVLCVNPTKYGRGYVNWHDKTAQFVVNMLDREQWYPIANGVVEVCGSVHDSSMLLKGGEE